MDITWQMAMAMSRAKNFVKNIGKNNWERYGEQSHIWKCLWKTGFKKSVLNASVIPFVKSVPSKVVSDFKTEKRVSFKEQGTTNSLNKKLSILSNILVVITQVEAKSDKEKVWNTQRCAS